MSPATAAASASAPATTPASADAPTTPPAPTPRFATPVSIALAAYADGDTTVQVSVDVRHDGIEYVGRLWFAFGDEPAIPDRGVLPGRTEAQVIALARDLAIDELRPRARRALAEKRRFHGLRQLTQDMLAKIRYLNQVAVSMRSGLLEADAGAQEIDLTEAQLVELARQVRRVAGLEG